jgi:hypothetical protein
MAERTKNRVEQLRGVRYGEVILVRATDGRITADVYNTMGFNDCPPEEFATLDAAAIAEEHGAALALLNGPRHWALDAIESSLREGADTAKFGPLEMFHAATIDFGSEPPGPGAYVERRVARDTVFEWSAGTPLHELIAPDGRTYVLQALSLAVDPAQTLATLPDLAQRLDLPSGWTFTTHTEPVALRLLSDVDGVATVVQDEFQNTYQRVDRRG